MEYLLVYLTGGLLYAGLELLWRGWTHWSMILCGGLCFLTMYYVNLLPISLVRKCVLSAAGITTIEFFTGILVNITLKWAVWDYSAMPGNILGQICPQFTLMWLLLSVPGLWLCERLKNVITTVNG